jgi:MFS family permease
MNTSGIDVGGRSAAGVAPSQPARLSGTLAIAMLVVLALGYMVNAMDRQVLPVLIPAVSREYHFALTQGGLLSTVLTLGIGLMGIPGGLLVDRLPRKTLIIASTVVFSVCTILTAFSVGFLDMAAYRIVTGIGEGLQNAAIYTVVGSYFVRHRTFAMGAVGMSYGIGITIAPPLATEMLQATGSWRTPMYVYGILGLVIAVAILVVVGPAFTRRGAVGAPAHDQARSAALPDRLFTRNTVLLGLACVTQGLAIYGFLGLYPTFLRGHLHFSLAQVGIAAGAAGLGSWLSSIPAGLLGDRFNQKWLIIIAQAVGAVVGFAVFNLTTVPVAQYVLAFIFGTQGTGLFYLNAYSLMQRSVRPSIVGRASGTFVTCLYLPAAFSGYLFALLVGPLGWGGGAAVQLTLLPLIALVAMLFFDFRRTERGARASA